MTDLRSYVGSADDVDLGSGTYELVGPPLVLSGQTLSADGAVINWTPTQDRSCSAIILRGTAPGLYGTAYVHGPAPDGERYHAELEAQHGVEVQGAVNAYIGGWQFRNTFGDGIYVGKSHDGSTWTQNLTIAGARTKYNGRNGISLVALDTADISGMEMQSANISVIDVEPPGTAWGVAGVSIHDIMVKDHGGGFVFACKGVGSSSSVHDISLVNIYCPNRDFSATVQPPADVRRSGFTFINCQGQTTLIRLVRCDHVTISQCGGSVVQTDCTDVHVT